MKTPSYPSGHAVQGYLRQILRSKNIEHSESFEQLGEDIAHSRIVPKHIIHRINTLVKIVSIYLHY